MNRSISEGLSLAGRSVLILEDEPLIAMTVQTVLEDAGVAFSRIAGSVASGREIIGGEHTFDAAIVDLTLTDGDATPLIEVLSKRGTRVVVTTGGDLSREQFAHHVAILKKPYSHGDLVKVVAWLIDGGRPGDQVIR